MCRFRQVDVFGSGPFLGNPVAVVLDAQGLTDDQMAGIARWTNLSETTFVLPATVPDADYRVRIFTPAEELPFAGHPTLGTCHAWLEAGGSAGDEVIQECGAGLIRIRRGDLLGFQAPPLLRSGPVEAHDRARILAALGLSDALDVQWVDNGPGWAAVMLPDAEAVLAVAPQNLDGLFLGVVGPGPDGLEVRAFFPVAGRAVEDPVTGSLNASVAQWLGDAAIAFPYVARQGRAVHRDGRVHLSRDADGSIWVAGATVTRVSGEVRV